MTDTRLKSKKPGEPAPFHLRFEIPIGEEDAQKRFLNRVHNMLFENFVETDDKRRTQAYWRIANRLGEKFEYSKDFNSYANGQFTRCLQVVEAAYESLGSQVEKVQFELKLDHIFALSEFDLGVAWQRGQFRRSGSTLLDQALINDPLGSLSDRRFNPVREPLIKALTHFLEGKRRPELYSDVITDCYEALEACAKLVTGRAEKDLSGNAELLVSKMPVSNNLKDSLKAQLKAYIAYGNLFRHAKKPDEHRTPPTKAEAEAFVYETGLFIRLSTTK